MNAKERAQQLAKEVVGLITGLRINESEGRATVLLPIAKIAPLAEKHIRTARHEAMEKCLTYIETAWLDKDGMLIAVDGKDFLDDVRSALIEQ